MALHLQQAVPPFCLHSNEHLDLHDDPPRNDQTTQHHQVERNAQDHGVFLSATLPIISGNGAGETLVGYKEVK